MKFVVCVRAVLDIFSATNVNKCQQMIDGKSFQFIYNDRMMILFILVSKRIIITY